MQQFKARLPPEIRREQLAQEWVECKSTAAAAKAGSDKAAHKAAGARMRELKLEMQRLGMQIHLLSVCALTGCHGDFTEPVDI